MCADHPQLGHQESEAWYAVRAGCFVLAERLAEEPRLRYRLLAQPQLLAEFCHGYLTHKAAAYDWSRVDSSDHLASLWDALALSIPMPAILDSWAVALGAEVAAVGGAQESFALDLALTQLCRRDAGLQ